MTTAHVNRRFGDGAGRWLLAVLVVVCAALRLTLTAWPGIGVRCIHCKLPLSQTEAMIGSRERKCRLCHCHWQCHSRPVDTVPPSQPCTFMNNNLMYQRGKPTLFRSTICALSKPCPHAATRPSQPIHHYPPKIPPYSAASGCRPSASRDSASRTTRHGTGSAPAPHAHQRPTQRYACLQPSGDTRGRNQRAVTQIQAS